jgi:two-component system cell cycle response regulator DivK
MEDTRQTVMVVDDTEDIRELACLQLTILGYRVLEAANGLEAVMLLLDECPVLILMDITMPVLDGLSATRLIREISKACDVVIVAYSALGSAESRERAIAAGCNDYLNKPTSINQLESVLSRHLSAS